MKILIAEDDFTCRAALQAILTPYGEVQVAADGCEALSALSEAMFSDFPYDLICLDIMMPDIDGKEVLSLFRSAEEENGVIIGHGTKIIMTTSLKDRKNVLGAFNELCDAYLVKPINKEDILKHLRDFKLLPF